MKGPKNISKQVYGRFYPCPRINFTVPIFHEGVNVTVRTGQWYNRLTRAQYFKLGGGHKLGYPFYGYAMTCFIVKCRLKNVSAELLALEHDPKCRKIIGLYEEMKKHGKVDSNAEITLIGFLPSRDIWLDGATKDEHYRAPNLNDPNWNIRKETNDNTRTVLPSV